MPSGEAPTGRPSIGRGVNDVDGEAKLFDFQPAAVERRFAGRDTSPGRWYENVVGLALHLGQYDVAAQQQIGLRLGSTPHIVDYIARAAGRTVLVSAKWQSRSSTGGPGSGEDKLLYEVLTLSEAIQDRPKDFACAYIVLGGMGFSVGKVKWFVQGMYRTRVVNSQCVECVRTDEFLERAFRHKL